MGEDARDFDHVVIGAGIAGRAAAYELSQRNTRVLLLERYQLGHVQGSSHGAARIFRLAYDDPIYVLMAQEARSAWMEMEQRYGHQLLRPGGVVDAGPEALLDPIAHSLRVCAAVVQSGPDVPGAGQFHAPSDFTFLHQPDGGTSWAARCLDAFLVLGQRQGLQVREECPAEAINDFGEGGVEVVVPGGAYRCRSVIVTAAGWSTPLLQSGGISLPLRVTREHVAYYQKRSPDAFLPFIWHPSSGPEAYGLPALGDETVKVGRHIAGAVVEPGSKADVLTVEVDLISHFVADHLPGLIPTPTHAETCLYASSPDDDFILDRVGNVVVGAGFGGHGFKFGPVTGRMLADLAQGGAVTVAGIDAARDEAEARRLRLKFGLARFHAA